MQRTRTRGCLGLLVSLLWVSTALAEGSTSELRVLTYNTHGLPSWLVSDDPKTRLPIISGLINAYDLVLIQENFAYPELLASSAEHPVIELGNPPRTAWMRRLPMFSGSGLTTLSSVPLTNGASVTREPLGVCSGWLSKANDCWASKGFLRLRVQLPNGGRIDVYNLHLDAGRSDDDRNVRRIQLERLGARVAELSDGQALIVAGDFNLNGSDSADALLLRGFRTELGLRDSGARNPEGGTFPNQLDYLLYRDGDRTTLEVLEAGPASEFKRDEVPLSDHPALFARFRVSPR
ncbi:MAG: endonuclease/exonuclease/phosphatase family protein [Myxococcota bacterium]